MVKKFKKELFLRNLTILFTLLHACTAREIMITEDFIEGELKTTEKILEDMTGAQNIKSMTVPLQYKF